MAAFDAASLTEGERTFLKALAELGVEYLLVGMSAALLSATSTTRALAKLRGALAASG